VKHVYGGNAIFAIVVAGFFFIAGSISVLWIKEKA
jgi:hypothetical protein